MDESVQQAIQIGVNVTIFIIALTISITLLIGVRDVAELASEYKATIPTGSRVVAVEEQEKRVIQGDELLSYCANYMTNMNGETSDRYVLTIKDGNNTISTSDLETVNNLKNQLGTKVSLKKDYEIITERYNKEDNVLYITLQSIENE